METVSRLPLTSLANRLRIIDPTVQSEFSDIHGTISEFEPGHQCYGVPSLLSTVTAGSNATIQMEYRANDSDKDENFFTCADIVSTSSIV